MLFSCDAKTPAEVMADYFPIAVDLADPARFTKTDWLVLVSVGDQTTLGRRLEWLLDHPSLRPLESDDDIEKNWGKPDAEMIHLRFYGGFEIVSADETARLRFEVSQMAEFTMSMQLIGC